MKLNLHCVQGCTHSRFTAVIKKVTLEDVVVDERGNVVKHSSATSSRYSLQPPYRCTQCGGRAILQEEMLCQGTR